MGELLDKAEVEITERQNNLNYYFDEEYDESIFINYLLKNKFLFSLYLGVNKNLRKIDVNNLTKQEKHRFKELKKMESRQNILINSLVNKIDKKNINFLNVFVNKEDFSIVKYILENCNINDETRKYIIKYMIDKDINSLEKLYYLLDQNNFKSLLTLLKEENYIYNLVRDSIKLKNNNFVKFIVKNKIIDINNIKWKNSTFLYITTATAAFYLGNIELGKFLYSDDSYIQNDSELRRNSDYILIDMFVKYNLDFNILLSLKHFNMDKENLRKIKEKINEYDNNLYYEKFSKTSLCK